MLNAIRQVRGHAFPMKPFSFIRVNKSFFSKKAKVDNNDSFCFNDSEVLKDVRESNKADEKSIDSLNKMSSTSASAITIDKPNLAAHAATVKASANTFKKDFLELTKFKLCVLNSWVSMTTYTFYFTNQALLDFFLFGMGTMGISMTTQVLNQLWEKIYDKQMKRTQSRPLPKQRMTDRKAFMIALGLWSSSAICYSLTNPNAIIFSNFILLLYIFGYTPMKRVNNLSMHIGAVVGALPALLGSYAATNTLFLPEALLLASYIFAWQYPHFYGILYQNKDDYKKAGFMFISRSEEKTKYAYAQMLVAMGLMGWIVYEFNKRGVMNALSTSLFYSFFAYSLIPVTKFISNPGKYSKTIRMRSYMPFMIVLLSFMLSINKRTEIRSNSESESSPLKI